MNAVEPLRVSVDGPVATVELARPQKLNALDGPTLDALAETVESLRSRTEVRCAIITGEGRAFVAGADIEAMKELDEAGAIAFARRGHAVFDSIEQLPIPVIAAVNGYALGGGLELALACDFIYAAERAELGQPETHLGIIPGFGGTQRLARRVGLGHARELIYTGRRIKAVEAERIGLVNRVCADDELLSGAGETALAIARVAKTAVTRAKRVLSEGEGLPLSEANVLEIRAFGECFAESEQREGMAAFLERRPPRF